MSVIILHLPRRQSRRGPPAGLAARLAMTQAATTSSAAPFLVAIAQRARMHFRPPRNCPPTRVQIFESLRGAPMPLTLIRRFHGSAYMFQLLANRAGPYDHTHSAAARIVPHHRRTALYTACRFQLLANQVGPYAHMPSVGRNNLAHRS